MNYADNVTISNHNIGHNLTVTVRLRIIHSAKSTYLRT